MNIKNLFRNPTYPIRLFDSNGNNIYYENSNGFWCKYELNSNGDEIYHEDSTGYWNRYEYDSNGMEVYFEDSDGSVRDNRPKTELTMDEIAEKFGINVNNLKIKKQ